MQPTREGRPPRIGIVVPRHGRTIVERNRLERRVRELLRTGWLPAERDCAAPRDLLVRAGAAAYDRSFADLRSDLQGFLESTS
jgi:ribonuclease P protein component